MEPTLYIGTNHFHPRPMQGCIQELKMIESRFAEQTVNGREVHIKFAQKKLWTRITFRTDDTTNFIFGLELGSVIRVGCTLRLWKKVIPNEIVVLKYRVCDNSAEGHDRQGQRICHLIGGCEIRVPDNVEFISYRPWINMVVTDILAQNADSTDWYFEAEEV